MRLILKSAAERWLNMDGNNGSIDPVVIYWPELKIHRSCGWILLDLVGSNPVARDCIDCG